MGLKADTSFLRFVTMGAIGTLATMDHLRRVGFEPIELERYCTSNKIWQTKVKRLRLPDLLCLRTGIRFEVRGKSTLAVKMSHADHNADRAWDAGLRDEDIAAFIWVAEDEDGEFSAPRPPVCFDVRDMRATRHLARPGPRKSASEGAERDLEWPTTVPKKPARITAVGDDRISIVKPGEARPNYTYRLKGKIPYVDVGDEVHAYADIIAGVVPRKSDLDRALSRTWAPRESLESEDPLARYVATKAMAAGVDIGADPDATLRRLATSDPEARIRIEAAGAAATRGEDWGFEALRSAALDPPAIFTDGMGEPAARMECVLVLSEVGRRTGDERAADALDAVVHGADGARSELRQAAVWGLGRGGSRSYGRLLELVADPDDDVALHAICAVGADVDGTVVDQLVEKLATGDHRERASVSEVIARTRPGSAVPLLAELARSGSDSAPWALATLGRLPLDMCSALTDLEALLAPVRVLQHQSWLASGTAPSDIEFLAAQRVGL